MVGTIKLGDNKDVRIYIPENGTCTFRRKPINSNFYIFQEVQTAPQRGSCDSWPTQHAVWVVYNKIKCKNEQCAQMSTRKRKYYTVNFTYVKKK